ncbi:McrC family protein [Aerosakkonemataceae cyanobacterium BLCC-F50]|uniref:McrC family protein n=1 Tax=Floridaenema flaviceps BLCC-F50 TaxID=3153642 RepID=A0ABV4XR31_9CYAN
MSPLQYIELTEYSSRKFEITEVEYAIAESLWRNYEQQITVNFPSPKTGGKWQLEAKGWVGHIIINRNFHLSLLPKVPLVNLFGMLEYAYKLKSFRFFQGVIKSESLEEFYNHLAYILAQRILDRCREGFYRAYMPKTANLPCVRGCIDMCQAVQKSWQVKLKCHYQEHTADIEENQILAWTLFIILRSGLAEEKQLVKLRQAYRTLQGLVTLKPFKPEDCIRRNYHRLNEDYQPLHALCRFFLENTEPTHEKGDRTMLPFLIDMAQLYEIFVVEWLKENLPSNLCLKFQERINIVNNITFIPDIVLYEISTGKARYILNIKYKTPTSPASDDLAQVIAQAVSKECQEVILVYPNPLNNPLDKFIGNIRVRNLTFSLNGNLEEAGTTFLQNLFS